MSKSQEDKIDEIHTAVLTMNGDFKSFQASCCERHKRIDEHLDGLNKEIYGNGKPGLLDNHSALSMQFDKFENKMALIIAGVILVVQIVGPKMLKMVGW